MSNILITGITGFVASHLAKKLSSDSDNTIFGLHRSIKDQSTFNALNLSNRDNINLIFGSINHPELLQEILNDYNIDQIYHVAAKSIVKNASELPVPAYVTNIFGTLCVLETARVISKQNNKEISVLVTSSDKAYGTSEILPYTESLPLNGLDIYSSSKACQDILARSYAYNYNLPIVTTRACNIYGEYDFNWSRIIPQFIKAYLTNQKITIYTNTANQTREYIYVDDLVEALIQLLSKDNIENTKGKAFNITSNKGFSATQILELFKDVTDYNDIEYISKDKGFKEIEDQVLDATRTRNTIGWCPKYELNYELFECIVDKYKKWFKSKSMLL